MTFDSTPHQHRPSGLPRFLLYCLLLSFLLHVLFIWLIPRFEPERQPSVIKPTYVTLENYPELPKTTPRERELDETPLPDQKTPEKVSRLAESNQKVEQEMAPRGEDSRDQMPIPSRTEISPAGPVSKPLPAPQPHEPEPKTKTTTQEKPIEGELSSSKSLAEDIQSQPDSNLSIDNLTKLTPDTMRRMARKEQRGRIKNREDVLEGDAVYLNLQQDYLLSFFKRFSNRIESAWNYPAEAAQRSEQGTLLLKITVTREGELVDVDLLDSSGSDALDYEAIQAVYRAAPFGPITRHWQHDEMKIYAHFQYTLSNRYIFGR